MSDIVREIQQRMDALQAQFDADMRVYRRNLLNLGSDVGHVTQQVATLDPIRFSEARA